MREPPIRARRRDLARLVEMAGRPDAQRLADRGDRRRRPPSVAPVGRASQSTPHRRRRSPSGTRLRASASARRCTRRAQTRPRDRSCRQTALDRATTSATLDVAAGTSARCGTGAGGGTRRRRRATPSTSSAHHGPLRDGRVGPKMPDDRRADGGGDVRRPGVAGHHDSRAPRDERDEVGDRRRRRRAAPRRRLRRRSRRASGSLARAPRARPTAGRAARAGAARHRAEPVGRPALVRPRRARIEQRIAPARLARIASAHVRLRRAQSETPARPVEAERRQQPEIQSARRAPRPARDRMPPRPGSYTLGVEQAARSRSRSVAATRSRSRAARPTAARERRLDQPLQVDRDVVAARRRSSPMAADGSSAAAPAPAIVDDERRSRTGTRSRIVAVLRADQPVDARGGKRAPQRRRDRDRVHDVAERAEADDEEVAGRSLSRKSRVAGRQSANEIARRVVFRIADDRRAAAVRRTTARSGTDVDRVVGALAVHVGLDQRVSSRSTVASPNTTT